MRTPLLTAFLHPFNLAVLALAVAAGLCAAWWLFPVGILVWIVMFLFVYQDPWYKVRRIVQSRQPLARRFQSRFTQIENSQLAIFNAINSQKRSSRQELRPVQEAVNEFTQRVYQLCIQMSALENHRLISLMYRNSNDDLERLNEKIGQTQDPVMKDDFEMSRNSLQERMESVKELSVLLDRFEAQLINIASAIGNVLEDILRINVSSPEDIRRELPGILQIIQTQSNQITDFERQSLNNLTTLNQTKSPIQP